MTETKRLVLVAKVTDIAGSEAGPNLTFSTQTYNPTLMTQKVL